VFVGASSVLQVATHAARRSCLNRANGAHHVARSLVKAHKPKQPDTLHTGRYIKPSRTVISRLLDLSLN